MSANSFGNRFQIHTFGESHGTALGVVIDGVPAGLPFDNELLLWRLKKRRPGQSLTSSRNESDLPEILSGVFEGKTLGTPIAIIVRNQDARSEDYEGVKKSPRIGHADDVWLKKFLHSDHRGGGRSSGRETLSRVLGGAVAQMVVRNLYPEINVKSFATRIGDFTLSMEEKQKAIHQDLDKYVTCFPSTNENQVKMALEDAKKEGESFSAEAQIVILNAPVGLGQPVFHKFKSDLASAYMGVGAVNSVRLGDLEESESRGTKFHQKENSPRYGGIRGGISTGENIIFNVSVKPTSSIKDIAKKGRHDPCIIIRAIPVIEAMTWLVLADHILWSRQDRI